MTNGEAFYNELTKFIEKHNTRRFGIDKHHRYIIRRCSQISCKDCIFNPTDKGFSIFEDCQPEIFKWFMSEYKEPVELSKLEYYLLKYLWKQGFNYICRNRNNSLWAFDALPKKYSVIWNYDRYVVGEHEEVYCNLFKFITWKEDSPRSIEDLMNNCKVSHHD